MRAMLSVHPKCVDTLQAKANAFDHARRRTLRDLYVLLRIERICEETGPAVDIVRQDTRGLAFADCTVDQTLCRAGKVEDVLPLLRGLVSSPRRVVRLIEKPGEVGDVLGHGGLRGMCKVGRALR